MSDDTAESPTPLPYVDPATTRVFRRELSRSDQYFRFGKTQLDRAMDQLKDVSGSDIVQKIRDNGFKITIGDVTFVLAESYGFCWGVERAVTMAQEARNQFPDKQIWLTNEIIHNPVVNQTLADMGMRFVDAYPGGAKDFSRVEVGDVVVLPAFGASINEMALLKDRGALIVDASCPWVTKVWTAVEKSKDKGHTTLIHGKYSHEETVATKSFAETYLVMKDMSEAEYVARYILGEGDREEFLQKFSKAMSEGFDPDVDLDRVGVANQTTMMKGETELIGKLIERTMIKKFGPQHLQDHFISFNTICDATQTRQDAMYKMFNATYEAPSSQLYAALEGEQVGVELLTGKHGSRPKKKADADAAAAGASAPSAAEQQQRLDLCLIVGGFNSSNTTHLLEIAEEEGVAGYHVDCAARIGGSAGGDGRGSEALANAIQHKPLATSPAEAMLDQGLELTEDFLPSGPVVIGITSGASTPDSVLGECVERILKLRGLSAS